MIRHWRWFLVCATLCLAGCSTETRVPREYAFAARKEVLVRSELDPTSDVRARLRHGERVAVEGRRRALLLVETGDGKRGWAREREFVLEPVRVQAECASRKTNLPLRRRLFTRIRLLHRMGWRWMRKLCMAGVAA